MKHRTLKEQIEGRCVHFNGCQHDKCKVGVEYKTFHENRGMAMPCLKHFWDGKEHYPCDKMRFPTEEEVAKELAVHEAAAARYMKAGPVIRKVKTEHKGQDWRGVEPCPVCGVKLHLRHAAYNGHVHGCCETPNCIAWME
jgi:hypothetical protein